MQEHCTPLLEAASAISSEFCLEAERPLERFTFFCDLFCRRGGPRGEDVSSSFEAASLGSLRRAPESCAVQSVPCDSLLEDHNFGFQRPGGVESTFRCGKTWRAAPTRAAPLPIATRAILFPATRIASAASLRACRHAMEVTSP